MVFDVIIISILAYSGFVFGVLLAFVAREEIKPGQSYFMYLHRITILVLSVILITKLNLLSWFVILALVTGLLISYFIKKKYLFFGITLFVGSLIGTEFLSIVSGLIFVAILPEGTLITRNNFSNKHKLLVISVTNFILFTIPLLLLLVKTSMSNNIHILLGFSIGSILMSQFRS